MKSYHIAVDFHGTCVGHNYPDTGKTIDLAVYYLQKLQRFHELILWTCGNDKELQDAIAWFAEHKIELNDIAYFPVRGVIRKVCADFFIDDKAIGTPLMPDPDNKGELIVDWQKL